MIHIGIQCYCFKMALTASSNQAINLLHPEQGANGTTQRVKSFPAFLLLNQRIRKIPSLHPWEGDLIMNIAFFLFFIRVVPRNPLHCMCVRVRRCVFLH